MTRALALVLASLGLLAPVVAQAPVTAVPHVVDFSAPLGPEWTLSAGPPQGRILVTTPAVPSPESGGAALLMDVLQPGVVAINEAVLHVDLDASGARLLVYRAREEADDDDPADGVFLSDGANEAQVVAHATALAPGWNLIEVDLVAAAQAHGLATGPGFRIVFRQQSQGPVPTDGIYLDDVRLLPPYGPGQANGPTAILDVNGGLEVNGLPAEIGRPGPFFASGSQLVLTVAGEPNRPFALIVGPLAPSAATFGAVGQLDLGLMPFFADLSVPMNGADGSQPLDVLAHTGPSGSATFAFGLAGLPPGVIGAFQAVVFDSSPVGAHLTAAFELTVTP